MKKGLSQIYGDIKNIKIQGATNIAKAAIEAYYIEPSNENKKKLIRLRPTEPMLVNVLNLVNKIPKDSILAHFPFAQGKINEFVFHLVKDKSVIYTHCHSTNVVRALISTKRNGKNFEVLNTETRPLFQGKQTSEELARNRIKVTEYIDSAMDEAIEKCDVVFLGCDAILKNGIINKIGSNAIAELSFLHKKPLFIIADSWKFSPKNVEIEERDFHEVWKHVPKHIKIANPAFELVDKKYIAKIVSELGILDFDDFIKKVEKRCC